MHRITPKRAPITTTVVSDEMTVLEESIVLNINPGRIIGQIKLEGRADVEHGDVTISLSNTSFTALTSEDGGFQLTDLPAGAYTLRASKNDFESLNLPSIIVNGGAETDLGELSMLRSRGDLSGQFQLAGAQTSEGVQVSLTNASGSLVASSITDSTGEYRFSGVPSGSYTLTACKQGYLPPNEINTVAVNANDEQRLGSVIINRPIIEFVEFASEVRTNNRRWRLTFDVPTDRVKAIKVTGEALMLDQDGVPYASQTDFVPFQTVGGQSFIDLELSDREGALLLNVTLRGDDCYLSETYNLVVNLDRTGPTLLDVQLQDGEFTNNRDTSIALVGFDAEEMMISGAGVQSVGGTADNTAQWIAASDSIIIGLTPGDGDKTIVVKTRDRAGNQTAEISRQIVLDTQAPSNASLAVFNPEIDETSGESYISSGVVNLSLVAIDPPANQLEMRLSNDPSFIGANWETFRSQVSWQLATPETDGIKTVYAQIRDVLTTEPEKCHQYLY